MLTGCRRLRVPAAVGAHTTPAEPSFWSAPTGLRAKSPRLPRRLPWVIVRQTSPAATRLRPICSRSLRTMSATTPLALYAFAAFTQGRRWRANLGLLDTAPLGEWPLLSNKASKAGISAAVIALRRISELVAWSVQTRILGMFTLDGARFSSAGSVANQIRGQGSQ